MQFGVFTVGDVTRDPVTGRSPTEGERVAAMVAIAEKAEEVGMDVLASGEHHNPPFVPSSPTTLLGFIAAPTHMLRLSTSTTLITTNEPVKIAEDYAMLQHLSELLGEYVSPVLRREFESLRSAHVPGDSPRRSALPSTAEPLAVGTQAAGA